VTFLIFRVFCIPNQLYFKLPNKIVILSGAPHRFIACYRGRGAESKDPEDAYLVDPVRTLSTTEARTWHTRHGLSLVHPPESNDRSSGIKTRGETSRRDD
jgi:hypothetical protein